MVKIIKEGNEIEVSKNTFETMFKRLGYQIKGENSVKSSVENEKVTEEIIEQVEEEPKKEKKNAKKK